MVREGALTVCGKGGGLLLCVWTVEETSDVDWLVGGASYQQLWS